MPPKTKARKQGAGAAQAGKKRGGSAQEGSSDYQGEVVQRQRKEGMRLVKPVKR